MKVFPFKHNGEQYEVRVVSDIATVNEKAFNGSPPVNAFQR